MKRQAENQITKDGDDSNDSDEGGERGMKKAPDAELGRRTIRPLPSRNKPPVQPASTYPSAANPGLTFSNPNPFGLTTPATGGAAPSSNAFSRFNVKPASANTTSFSSTNNAFSLSSSSTSTSPFASKPPQTTPSVAPTSTAKTFASLLGNSNTSPFGAPTPSSAPSVSSPGKAQEDSKMMKYHKNMRGLNVSLLSAISKSVEDDPFVDLSETLEKYKAYRTKVQAEFDEPSTTSTSSSQPPPTSTSPPASEKPAMPAPPTTFAGFGGFKPPNPSIPTSPPSSSVAPPSNTSNAFGFNPTASAFGSTSGFTLPTGFKGSSSGLGSFASGTTATSPTPAPTASFSFGTSSDPKPASTPSFFGSFGSGTNATSQPSSTSSSNPFGLTSSTSNAFSFSKPAEKSESTSLANPFSVPEKPAGASSGFFSSPASKAPAGGNFLSFGSSSSSTNAFTPSAFGKSEPTSATAASAEENTTEGENSERGTPTAEADIPPSGLNTVNPLDEEGAGEENEETVHAAKAKAFKLSKDPEGAAKWLQLGTGILRLKKDKETDARRLLLRNSTNGKVITNFKIYSALKPTQNKSALSFIGHEDGAPVTYSIRLATEGDAKNLKDALDREIAAVKAKE